MKTFECVQSIFARAATLGLLMGVASCGSAPDTTNAPEAPSAASSEASSQRASRDLASIERVSGRGPQDPTAPRPSTKEACDACQGLWAVHGLGSEEFCICKTNDEGRECIDGKDCAGECLLDDNAEFQVMDHGNPPRGYYRGRCAGYDTTFGCFRHIADNIQGQIPLTADEASENVCVD